MKVIQKHLANFKTNISFIGILSEYKSNITTLKIPNKIFSTISKIGYKNFELIKHISKISGPVKTLLSVTSNITSKQVKLLLNSNTMLNLKFFIDKEKYKNYSPVIYDNIDDLYIRISGMYQLVSNKLAKTYGMDYVKDSYELTEEIFCYILSDLQKYKEYSEITDRELTKEIVMYFRGLE